jgi:Arc/MetJ-type ribon-helix-helix transcriptional regulator
MTERDTVAAVPERAISVRLDEQARRALDELMASGLPQSEAIRRALIYAAARLRPATSLSAEATMLAANEDDRHEVADVRTFMDELRAPG